MVTKLFVRIIGITLIALQLFAQTASASQPCVAPGMSVAQIMVEQSDHECCDVSVSTINLCAIKCVDSAKTSAHTPQPVLSVPAGTINLPRQNDVTPIVTRYTYGAPPIPKTIRLCCLLI